MSGKTSRSSDDNEWEGTVKYKVKAAMESHDGKLKVSSSFITTVVHTLFHDFFWLETNCGLIQQMFLDEL